MPYLTASAASVVKDVLAILGGCIALFAAVYGVWAAIRRRREVQAEKQQQQTLEVSGKFATIEADVVQLHTIAQDTKRQYGEFQQRMDENLKVLAGEADRLKDNCTRHQQSADIEELRRATKRLSDQFDQLHRDFMDHREQVAERYLTMVSYQSDLSLWTNNFDSLRQSIRDLTLLLGKKR